MSRLAVIAALAFLPAIGGAQEQQPEADYVILRAADYQRVSYMLRAALEQLHVHHAEIHKLRADNEQLRVDLYRCRPELHPPPAPASGKELEKFREELRTDAVRIRASFERDMDHVRGTLAAMEQYVRMLRHRTEATCRPPSH